MPRARVHPTAGDGSTNGQPGASTEPTNMENEVTEYMRKFPSDAFGKLHLSNGNANAKPDHGWYIRLNHETDAKKILELFHKWGMSKPDVILSVLSTDKSIDGKPTTASKSTLEFRTMICSSLVEAAASINAWIITGGLNRGVDELIGNEVKQRRANNCTIPKAVLGICNWGCLEDSEKDLLHESCASIGGGLSLNQFHTHFILVDDGTQMKLGCQRKLRETVEVALTDKKLNAGEIDLCSPLIYIVIGGSVKEFGFVKSALDNRIPVVVTLGTGGASEIIYAATETKEGATLKHLPEIYEIPFNQLKELLKKENIPVDVVEEAIANVKAMKFQLFCRIVELLDKMKIPDADKYRYSISRMKNKPTNKLLSNIKKLITSDYAESDEENYSAANAEYNTASRMRAVIKKLLVVNGIKWQTAREAVNKLEHSVLNDMLIKVKSVFVDLNAIRQHKKKELLIKFNIKNRFKRRITSVIVEALKKAKWTKPSYVYMLAVDWNHETSFTNLLKDNWMSKDHESVFRKLLQREDKTKYVQLMLENMGDNSWLTKPEGPLEDYFRKNELCENLKKQIKDRVNNTRYHDERIRGKMLFLWCNQKQMPKTAMLFWNQGQDCLAMILMAYKESRKQKQALVDKEGYEQMKDQMQDLEKLALNFVKKCYANSPQNTQDLLVCKVDDLDGLTPLQIAVDAKFKAFLYVEPTKNLLNKIWTKNVEFYDNNRHFFFRYFPMLLSIGCPLLAPVLLDVRKPSDNSNDVEQKSMTTQKSKSELSYLSQLQRFINIPLVIFSYWFISYIAYIILFSIVLLTDFRARMSPTEIALTIWTSIIIIEEVRQAKVNIPEYKENKWNYFDILAITLYIIGFILRMIYHFDPTICAECLYQARIVLAFSLMFFFFRTLQFLSNYDAIGPKISMIRRLIFSDLIPLLLILAVFVSAYGVVSNVILYPNQPLNDKLLQDVFYDAWWSVIQQFNRDDALGSMCNANKSVKVTAEYCSNPSDDSIDYVECKKSRCPANKWIVSVLLAFYALLTCIMLLNVLIAMFNKTFTNVDDRHKDISTMQRYRLIREYSSHARVPPPFCVIPYMVNIYRQCVPKKTESPPETFEKDLTSEVKDWQTETAEAFYRDNHKEEGWPVLRMDLEDSDVEETALGRDVI